jgi:Fic family protein
MGVRSTGVQRDSRPASHQLFKDKDEKARLEARNGLLQFDEVLRLAGEAIESGQFKLRPSTIQLFQRLAIKDIYTCAGNFRTGLVSIGGSNHAPPPPEDIARQVEDLCDYVNDAKGKTPIHFAAYIMWRINWIHPFAGGNGRTSRAVSYLVLLIKLGQILPGTKTIPEQIVDDRAPYYAALDAADAAWTENRIDVSEMEKLLSSQLAKQLVRVYRAASQDASDPDRGQ